MKKYVFFILLASGVFSLSAQNPVGNTVSPAENFANRKGTTLEKRFDEVGKISSLNIQLEYISDLSNSDKIQCIRFDVQMPNNATGPSALLDTNEVNELLHFLNYISTNVINRPPVDPNTEISFADKYNLQIGCYWQKNNGWTLFIRTDGADPATETDIAQIDIPQLIKTLTLAKSEIQKS